MVQAQTNRGPIVVGPEDGRVYPMGRIRAVFKADLGETAERYSVSEWWLEPRTRGPGAHQHARKTTLFHVISGMLSVLTGDIWSDAGAGTYVVISGERPTTFRTEDPSPRASSPSLRRAGSKIIWATSRQRFRPRTFASSCPQLGGGRRFARDRSAGVRSAPGAGRGPLVAAGGSFGSTRRPDGP